MFLKVSRTHEQSFYEASMFLPPASLFMLPASTAAVNCNLDLYTSEFLATLVLCYRQTCDQGHGTVCMSTQFDVKPFSFTLSCHASATMWRWGRGASNFSQLHEGFFPQKQVNWALRKLNVCLWLEKHTSSTRCHLWKGDLLNVAPKRREGF